MCIRDRANSFRQWRILAKTTQVVIIAAVNQIQARGPICLFAVVPSTTSSFSLLSSSFMSLEVINHGDDRSHLSNMEIVYSRLPPILGALVMILSLNNIGLESIQ